MVFLDPNVSLFDQGKKVKKKYKVHLASANYIRQL